MPDSKGTALGEVAANRRAGFGEDPRRAKGWSADIQMILSNQEPQTLEELAEFLRGQLLLIRRGIRANQKSRKLAR